jgi:ABC-type transport system involved in multi-copper enzyme maturation permease subunit
MFNIAGHQIASGLKDAKFLFMLVIVVIAFIFNAFSYSARYAQDMDDWQISLKSVEAQLELNAGSLQLLANAPLELVKHPSPLTFISDSGDQFLPNSITGNAFTVRNLRYLSRGNEMQSALPPVDWNFIIGSLMSLLAVLISYRAICGEKRDGTLRLLLSNPVSRMKLFFGKFIGLAVVLLVAFAAGIVLNLMTILSLGTIHFDSVILGAIGWAALAGTFYLLFFLLAGLCVSSLTQRPAISLVVLLACWILVVIAVPGLARIVVEQAFKVRSLSDVDAEIIKSYHELYESAPLSGRRSTSRGADNVIERTNLANACLAAEIRIKNAAIAERVNQAETVHTFSIISPAGVLTGTLESLSSTGIAGFATFIEKADRYRQQLYSFVVERDRTDPTSPHIMNSWGHYSEYATYSIEPVDVATVPRWQSLWQEGSQVDQPSPVPQLLNLLAAGLVMGLVAFIALAKYDPR